MSPILLLTVCYGDDTLDSFLAPVVGDWRESWTVIGRVHWFEATLNPSYRFIYHFRFLFLLSVFFSFSGILMTPWLHYLPQSDFVFIFCRYHLPARCVIDDFLQTDSGRWQMFLEMTKIYFVWWLFVNCCEMFSWTVWREARRHWCVWRWSETVRRCRTNHRLRPAITTTTAAARLRQLMRVRQLAIAAAR